MRILHLEKVVPMRYDKYHIEKLEITVNTTEIISRNLEDLQR